MLLDFCRRQTVFSFLCCDNHHCIMHPVRWRSMPHFTKRKPKIDFNRDTLEARYTKPGRHHTRRWREPSTVHHLSSSGVIV